MTVEFSQGDKQPVANERNDAPDLNNKIVGQALSLLTENSNFRPGGGTNQAALPPEFANACISILPIKPESGAGSLDRFPLQSQPADPHHEIELCAAAVPRTGDPPIQLEKCVFMLPKPGDLPREIDHCSFALAHSLEPQQKSDVGVAAGIADGLAALPQPGDTGQSFPPMTPGEIGRGEVHYGNMFGDLNPPFIPSKAPEEFGLEVNYKNK